MPLSGLLVGLAFGFLLQRGQFCFVCGFRELFQKRDPRFMLALLLAVAIQSVGFFGLQAAGLIRLPTEQMPILATVLGGLLFGMGIILARCCGSGSWFRSGEGAAGSLLVLLVFAITLAACQAGPLKNLLQPLLQQTSSLGLIHETLGIAPWWCVAALVVMCAGLLWRARRQATSSPSPASDAAEAVEAGRYPLGIAALIGLLGVLAWWLSWQSGRNYGYGVAVPTANVLQYLVTGQSRYLNWGSLFVLGILPGAFFSAWLRGQFRWRVPPVEQVPQCILGGVLMGVGATLAGGCTITNTLVATAYFSWQGWLATLMILLGCWLALRLLRTPSCA
ncbi:YeeE/YedE family protein [Lautropia dentalis]|uniref:YeeE/YedE family protein n=1 Tax=Lautropia dentalis TaxID=2490857 RepID=A0A426FQ51_9BURK|nr:YeeE/YedE family protein [Lautropia dentalis]RRN44858.1 YeeE/YedE family protein [Lautropia dentalis]